jgi:hypothetical protein
VISEALYYDTVFNPLSKLFGKFLLKLCMNPNKNAPSIEGAFPGCNSLTMSYFHTGIRTIIGAEAFHCPVRDGKEWYHFAMVVRHNLLSHRPRSAQPIYRANQLSLSTPSTVTWILNASTWHNILETLIVNQSYRVKPHEQLVQVSLTHYCASTPCLSTSWS